MKVKELINLLQKQDQEADIYLETYSAEDGGTGEIEQIYNECGVVCIKEGTCFDEETIR